VQIFDERGHVANWDGYEAVLHHIFYKQLGWPVGDEGCVLLTANSLTMMRSDRERLVQMLFEVFNVKGVYLLEAATAAVYAAGKISGICVDMGHTGTNVAQARVPMPVCGTCVRHGQLADVGAVLAGACMADCQATRVSSLGGGPHTIQPLQLIADYGLALQVVEGAVTLGSARRLPLGGAAMDSLLRRALAARGVALKESSLAALKHKCATAAETAAASEDMLGEANRMEEATEVELPDGQKIVISTEGCALERHFATRREHSGGVCLSSSLSGCPT
jgi:Actin